MFLPCIVACGICCCGKIADYCWLKYSENKAENRQQVWTSRRESINGSYIYYKKRSKNAPHFISISNKAFEGSGKNKPENCQQVWTSDRENLNGLHICYSKRNKNAPHFISKSNKGSGKNKPENHEQVWTSDRENLNGLHIYYSKRNMNAQPFTSKSNTGSGKPVYSKANKGRTQTFTVAIP